MSENAKKEMKIWLAIKAQRIVLLRDKYGFVPCEYCHTPIINLGGLMSAEAHHNNHRRRQNTLENCRITHAYCNRILIEDNNVRDVPSLL